MIKTYFLRPGQNELVRAEFRSLFHMPEDLHIAMAYVNNSDVADWIKQRIVSGYRTRLIINNADIIRPHEGSDEKFNFQPSKALMEILIVSRSSDLLQIRTLGGAKSNKSIQTMHHKICFTKKIALVGSLNLTFAAFRNNYESIIKVEEVSVINEIRNEFNVLWEFGDEIKISSNNKVRSVTCPHCKVSDGIDFESYGLFCTFCGSRFKISND